MLHIRRRREAVGDQLAPFLEVRRAAKIVRMVLDRVPADEQTIAAWPFDRAAQLHAAAAFGALKNWDCLLHPFFKFRFSTRLHINLRNFGDHDRSLFVVLSAISLRRIVPPVAPPWGEQAPPELSIMTRITAMRAPAFIAPWTHARLAR